LELDESVCLPVQDQDLEGALKAFQEDVDPWNLAFIKYKPSAKNYNSNFADETYRPPNEMSYPQNAKIIMGTEHLTKETPNGLRIQDKFRQPIIELSSSGKKKKDKQNISLKDK
jgi:hypothetical protein